MLATPSKFQNFGEFFRFFVPSLTGVVAFWATVALNIPDFTRYAKGQREQMIGQALGLPTTMTFYSFIGIAVTSATVVVFGQAIWDPVAVLARLGSPIAVVIAMVALLMATLNVNVAANVVSPANDFSNLWPRRISFRTGGLLTCLIGVLMQPWKLLASYGNYVSGWLVGYSGFLGPVAGILICDYFVRRKKILNAEDLYRRGGVYEFSRGVNWKAILALVAGCGGGVRGTGVCAGARAVRLRVVRGIWREFCGVLGVDAAAATPRRLARRSCRPPSARLRTSSDRQLHDHLAAADFARSALVAAGEWERKRVRRLAHPVVPAHRWLAGVDLLHRDAVLDRADQRAQIAADAFLLDDARNVNAEAAGILLRCESLYGSMHWCAPSSQAT